MLTIDRACRVLGIDPGADRDEIRAAFRRRMREFHPDVSGDASPAAQATTRDVIDAYRRLSEATIRHRDRQPKAGPPRRTDRVDPIKPRQVRQRGPNPRLVQVAMASALVFGATVFVLFFLVAFSQSGR